MRLSRFLATGMILLAAVAASAQTRRVAVLPFDNDGLAASDVRGLTLFFETALQNTKLCEIVEQTKVEEILKAHQFVLADFNDPAKAIAIGKLVPANTIALGAAGKLGGRPYLNVKLIDLVSGTIVAARNVTAASVEALTSELNALAAGILGSPSSSLASPPEASRPGPPVPLTAVPRVARSQLSMFESGPGIPPVESRIYAVTFFTAYTRFINWDLFLEFSAPVSQNMSLPVDATILRSNGTVLTVQSLTAELRAGWSWFRMWNGWGAPNPYNWAPDTYTLRVTMGGVPVATTTFVVR